MSKGETMMEKILSFEEWWGTKIPDRQSTAYAYAESAWNAARQGLIPADRAIEVPPVEQWPKWAKRISVLFDGAEQPLADKLGLAGIIAIFPRPTSQWSPQIGEAVFIVRGDDIDVSVCRFSHIDEHGIWRVVTVKGQEQGFTASLVKPFDQSKIGLPWSQI